MPIRTSNAHSPPKQAPLESISGEYIAKAHRGYRPGRRAQDAARWIKGEVQITPTVKLAACVFGVSVPSVMKARARLNEHEQLRHADARARKFHNGNGTIGSIDISMFVKNGTAVSDRVVDHMIVEIGPDRILQALDRVTSPELPLQAAH